MRFLGLPDSGLEKTIQWLYSAFCDVHEHATKNKYVSIEKDSVEIKVYGRNDHSC